MAAISPFLRPLGIAAGGLGFVQAITWGILSLLGILLYTGVMIEQSSDVASNQFQKVLVDMYFSRSGTNLIDVTTWFFMTNFTDLNIMTPGTVVVWTSTYFATSVIWLMISSFLIYDSYNSEFTSIIIIGWVAVSAVVAAIDFAGTVAFGVDYNRVQSELDKLSFFPLPLVTEFLHAPIFMMTVCARGFILWIINVGLVIYLGVAERKLRKMGSPNLTQEREYSSRSQSFDNHYYNSVRANTHSSPIADSTSQGRQNTAFQPDSIYAQDTQSPTVGNQQPSQMDFPQNNSSNPHDVVNPISPIPQARKTLATPVAPLPTPQPDYSPPTQHQNHEPNMYEAHT